MKHDIIKFFTVLILIIFCFSACTQDNPVVEENDTDMVAAEEIQEEASVLPVGAFSNNYHVKNNIFHLCFRSDSLIVGEFIKTLKTDGVTVCDKDGNILSPEDRLTTKCVVLYDNIRYPVAVFGDVNCDGNIDQSDLDMMNDENSMKTLDNDSVLKAAADLNCSGNLNSADADSLSSYITKDYHYRSIVHEGTYIEYKFYIFYYPDKMKLKYLKPEYYGDCIENVVVCDVFKNVSDCVVLELTLKDPDKTDVFDLIKEYELLPGVYETSYISRGTLGV